MPEVRTGRRFRKWGGRVRVAEDRASVNLAVTLRRSAGSTKFGQILDETRVHSVYISRVLDSKSTPSLSLRGWSQDDDALEQRAQDHPISSHI